jgi:multisubunit Na+/H+ antiporter MnhB subunit
MALYAWKLALLRQGAVFMGYLVLCSLVLLNHAGGADIGFTALLVICILLHAIVLLVLIAMLRKSGRPKKVQIEDVLVLIVLVGIFYSVYNPYLRFMWWLTV